MNRKEKFEDLQLDFYRWMIDFIFIATHTNYIFKNSSTFFGVITLNSAPG